MQVFRGYILYRQHLHPMFTLQLLIVSPPGEQEQTTLKSAMADPAGLFGLDERPPLCAATM